ncbi:MAG: helix-turn-helix domain-containing protein, partial [Planctomycetaceae bacterium]|nr:helix-turn-helix domain-containing protein [Planctomycetaceae bacterium]
TRENAPGREVQLRLDYSGRRNALREFLTEETHVKHLLRVLMDHIPQGDTDCFLTIETICREMSAKRRTVQKAIAEAKEQGYLIVYGPSRTRNCNTYRVRFSEIREAWEFENAVRQAWNANYEGCCEEFRDYRAYLNHLREAVADRAEYARGWRNMCVGVAQPMRPENVSKQNLKPPLRGKGGGELKKLWRKKTSAIAKPFLKLWNLVVCPRHL